MIDFTHLLSVVFPKGVQVIALMISLLVVGVVALGVAEARRFHVLSGTYFTGLIFRACKFFGMAIGVTVAFNQVLDVIHYAVMNYTTDRQRVTLIVSGLTLASGVSAYLFRLSRQGWYGIAEILVGILVAQQSFPLEKVSQRPSVGFVVQFLVSIYVVVRGLSNAADGFLGKVHNMSELVDAISKKIDPEAAISVTEA